MDLKRLTLATLAVIVFCMTESHGQNILVLEKAGSGRIHMFYAGNHLKLKAHSSSATVQGVITMISDSSLVINRSTEVLLHDIAVVYHTRWGFSLLQKLLLGSGILYLSLSALNGVIHHDSPVIPTETAMISGGLVAAGILVTPMVVKRHKITPTTWKLKILDFTD